MLSGGTEAMKGALIAVMISNFALNIALSGSLNLLWGLLNTLQLLSHVPLLKINFPANAKTLFVMINEIASFNILPLDAV